MRGRLLRLNALCDCVTGTRTESFTAVVCLYRKFIAGDLAVYVERALVPLQNFTSRLRPNEILQRYQSR